MRSRNNGFWLLKLLGPVGNLRGGALTLLGDTAG